MRIAVAGGGIAGLAAALALSRRGHDIAVLERRTGFGETGAGIQLSPNATHVLTGLGLGPALARHGCEPDRIVVRRLGSGREIAGVALGSFMRARFGAPYVSIARADLHTALLDAARGSPDIRIRAGRSVVGLEELGHEVTLSTEGAGGNREAVTCDLLVGADGIGSRLRASIGDGRALAYSGYAAYRATLPIGALPAELGRNETGLWLGSGQHVVHYPIASGRLLNVVAVTGRAASVEGWSNAEERGRVLDLFGSASTALRAVLSAAETWSAWSLFSLPARTMGRGHVALVGDAAHPVPPYLAQGGSLAIEDGAELAARLGTDPGKVTEAVAAYSRARLLRVRRVQDAARRNGRIYHAAGPIAFARDLVMRRLGPEGMSERYAWVYGWTPGA